MSTPHTLLIWYGTLYLTKGLIFVIRRRRRYRVVSWDLCVTLEWPRRTAHLHRSAGERILLPERIWSSHLLLGWLGGRFQLGSGNRPERCRSGVEELDESGCYCQVWLRHQRQCSISWRSGSLVPQYDGVRVGLLTTELLLGSGTRYQTTCEIPSRSSDSFRRDLKTFLFSFYERAQRIGGFAIMRCVPATSTTICSITEL